MAPKRLLQDPPAASSMEEDSDAETLDEEQEEEEEEEEQNDAVQEKSDEEEEEEEEEEEDNEEEENVNAKKPVVIPSSSVVPNPQSESASSEDDDAAAGSETESDDINHSPSASDFTVKPIVSKPVNDSSSAKPTKKPAPAPAKPAPGSKRPAESDPTPKDSRKKKKGANGGDDEDTKKGRLWGEDDEIAILKGMIDFKAKKGIDPSSNMGAFHEFLKRSLKADVSKNQLMDKARRLKKKYHTNAEKGENGEGPVFSKAHELKSFDLSKKIWGAEANGGDDSAKNSRKKPRKSAKANNNNNNNSSTVLALPVSDAAAERSVEKKVKVEEMNVANGGVKAAESDDFWSKYPSLSDSLQLANCSSRWEGLERVMIQKMPSIGSSKAKELDDRWRKLQVLEMELTVKKLDLMHEQAKLLLDGIKSRKD
ncbi:putative transcription factor GeBP family [Rosa chinensis]|uniref:Putative transcription factor GeBP family n=1 Tax=Rosa chinensis TaxID=74649 RepID=A0A2P6S2H8_ROSCH|nr:STOREKEEPER protein [Rosa chinensis]PRQ52882.1 putative transcription factor GeBP family [Rosa chinensis]